MITLGKVNKLSLPFLCKFLSAFPQEGRGKGQRTSQVWEQEHSCTLLELTAEWFERSLENMRAKTLSLIFWFRSKTWTLCRFGQPYCKFVDSYGTEFFPYLLETCYLSPCYLFFHKTHSLENKGWALLLVTEDPVFCHYFSILFYLGID